MSWSWKKDLRKGDDNEAAWEPYSVQDMLLLESAFVDGSLSPVTLSNKEHCVDISKMVQFRLGDPSRRRAVRRLEVATPTAPRVKITKRKAPQEDVPTHSPPSKKTKLQNNHKGAVESSHSSFHTTNHFLLRDWLYNDKSNGFDGLDDEFRAESSPPVSAVHTDLVENSPDLVDLWKLYKLFKAELLWYFGDSDCNWFPFVIKQIGTLIEFFRISYDFLTMNAVKIAEVQYEDIAKKRDLFWFDTLAKHKGLREMGTAVLKSSKDLREIFRLKIDPNNRAPIQYPMFVGGRSQDGALIWGIYVLCTGSTP